MLTQVYVLPDSFKRTANINNRRNILFSSSGQWKINAALTERPLQTVKTSTAELSPGVSEEGQMEDHACLQRLAPSQEGLASSLVLDILRYSSTPELDNTQSLRGRKQDKPKKRLTGN